MHELLGAIRIREIMGGVDDFWPIVTAAAVLSDTFGVVWLAGPADFDATLRL